MTDKPILFSAPMVRALLAGTKTQTRRVLKPQPDKFCRDMPNSGAWSDDYWRSFPSAPGQRLWVREAWGLGISDHGDCPRYKATMDYQCGDKIKSPHEGPFKWRSPIFMPRKFSRLMLIVTDVRVQRLQEINEEDAIAEGIYWSDDFEGWTSGAGADESCDYHSRRPDVSYAKLWDRINGDGAWALNPWVCAISFSVHRANIDALELSNPEPQGDAI